MYLFAIHEISITVQALFILTEQTRHGVGDFMSTTLTLCREFYPATSSSINYLYCNLDLHHNGTMPVHESWPSSLALKLKLGCFFPLSYSAVAVCESE